MSNIFVHLSRVFQIAELIYYKSRTECIFFKLCVLDVLNCFAKLVIVILNAKSNYNIFIIY